MSDWDIYDSNGKTVRSFQGMSIREYQNSSWFQDDLHKDFLLPFTAVRWPDEKKVIIEKSQLDLLGGRP